MKISDKIGITPEHYAKVKLSDFLKEFKGKASVVRLTQIHAECVKKISTAELSESIKKKKDEAEKILSDSKK